MSVFSDDRAAIAEALEAFTADGVTVYDHLPSRAVPPCAMVLVGAPMLERLPTDPIGSATARYEVWLAARAAANETATDEIESMTERAVEMLRAAGFDFERVEQPFSADFNGTRTLATSVHVTSGVSLT